MKLNGNLYYGTQISFAYNTNHIEGSKLTKDQTRYIYDTNTILNEKSYLIDTCLSSQDQYKKMIEYYLK